MTFLLLPQNTMTKKKVGEEGVYLVYPSTLPFITKRSQDRNSNRAGSQSAWADSKGVEGRCLLACSPWLSQPSFLQNQDYQPRDGTNHHWLGLPPLITRWENTLQLDLKEAFPQQRLLPLWWPQPVSNWRTKPATTVLLTALKLLAYLLPWELHVILFRFLTTCQSARFFIQPQRKKQENKHEEHRPQKSKTWKFESKIHVASEISPSFVSLLFPFCSIRSVLLP